MSDLTEELSKLAELRDKGVLTQEEFDHQKALLLNPPAPPPHVDAPTPPPPPAAPTAPYVAPAAGGTNTTLYVVGGLVLLVALAGVLWATGALKSLGLNPPGSSGDTSLAFNSSSFSNSVIPAAAPTAPTMPVPVPTAPPSYAAPTTDASNPMLGSWEGNSSNKSSCPTRLAFTATYLMFVASENGSPQTKTVNVTYNVQSATAVEVTPVGEGHPATAVITGNQMVLDDCGFTRSGG